MTKTPYQLMQQINEANLSADDLCILNRMLCDAIKIQQQNMQRSLGSQFKPGDIVSFASKRRFGDTVYVKVNGYNRARTCLTGNECDAKGTIISHSKYSVSPSLCTIHTPN